MGDKPPSFQPPPWAAAPSCSAWLEARRAGDASDAPPLELVRVDAAPYVTFGRDAEVANVHLDDRRAAPAEACFRANNMRGAAGRLHAAIVHHTSGKVYIIELDASHGTWVDSLRLEKHRPLTLKDGFRIRFGEGASRLYTVRILAGSAEAGGSGAGSMPPVVRPSSKRPREGAAPDDGRTVRASHILIKHAGSRRPSSFREPVVTRSKEEAIAALDAIAARLAAGEPFAAVAEAESHCSSAKRGGDLGVFGRGKMQAPFEHAAFALQVGQLSGVVDTDSGVHLILRTE